MIKGIAAFVLCLIVALPTPVFAHTDEHFDHVKTPHGGQMRMAGPFHLELVVQGDAVVVYVSDHADAEMATAGASGVATVVTGKDKVEVPLAPAGGNMLRGRGPLKLQKKTQVMVRVSVPGRGEGEARFQPGSTAHKH
jgi:hypothetical protein